MVTELLVWGAFGGLDSLGFPKNERECYLGVARFESLNPRSSSPACLFFGGWLTFLDQILSEVKTFIKVSTKTLTAIER